MGFMCLGYALILWLQLKHAQGLHLEPDVCAVHLGWVNGRDDSFGTRAIQDHITYPRTGFVAYRTQNRILGPAIIASVVSALSVACLSLAARSHRDIGDACLF